MKKTLTLLLALFAIGVTSGVRADSGYDSNYNLGKGYYGGDDYTMPPLSTGDPKKIGFRTDWCESQSFGIKPINIGDSEVEVKTEPYAIIIASLNSKPAVFGRADSSGKAKLDLQKKENRNTPKVTTVYGDKVRITIKDSEGFGIGSETWIVGKSKPKDQIEKEEEKYEKEIAEILEKLELQEQEREALDLFKNAANDRSNKPWHQRLSESIQDQWWNFKGLFQ
ncbi:TPA: hypothetical protein ACQOFD_000461 [Streptococcus pyogenes]|uniref:hypothetical protein n=1 Tax=Streptococcus pyogenes TaxID=1314 RepID=UPI0010A19288|nr:hypothetical protein [Streptococcus pyogenes]VGY30252.1 secreted phage protein [Streptococcus pyogenes]VHE39473.1 secreted phage protein [Streptococcus pyogenes]VHF35390.1 secreted phage protein [Streptococcus pyogenes]VHG86763.1 secreted phage protein [Streptococcus pyogenes]VHM74411.1 secreted phage protein [Streptococcus pyogenes]